MLLLDIRLLAFLLATARPLRGVLPNARGVARAVEPPAPPNPHPTPTHPPPNLDDPPFESSQKGVGSQDER